MRVYVWDIWTRLFHWSLVLSVLFLLFSGKTGNGFFDWHRYIGELVACLILFRFIWGLLGSSNIRLLSLIRSPLAAITHLRELATQQLPPERGHNAAGGWAVLGMLLLIGIQAGTGMIIADEDELLEGAFYGSVDSATSSLAYTIHHTNSTILMILLAVHVAMILIYRVWGKQNLLTAMITGWMQWREGVAVPDLQVQRWWIGLLIAIACFAVSVYLLGWQLF